MHEQATISCDKVGRLLRTVFGVLCCISLRGFFSRKAPFFLIGEDSFIYIEESHSRVEERVIDPYTKVRLEGSVCLLFCSLGLRCSFSSC
jgi:hypothetical protein